MKNSTTKSLLLTCLCMVLFTAISYAQCAAGLLAYEELKEGKKVIIAEVYKDENTTESYDHLIGKAFSVGKTGIINIGDCWFMGDLNVNGEDVFFVGVTLKAAAGESYDGPVLAAETKAASAFPVGCKVNVVKPDDKPYSLLSALSEEENGVQTGTVVEADLKPLGDNWYSGKVKLSSGVTTTYAKAQFQLVK